MSEMLIVWCHCFILYIPLIIYPQYPFRFSLLSSSLSINGHKWVHLLLFVWQWSSCWKQPKVKVCFEHVPKKYKLIDSLEIKSWEIGLLSSQMLSPPWLQNHSNMSYQFDNLKINDVQRLLPCAKFVDVLLKQNNEPINF
jgi:hypothetical protein